MTDTLEQIQQQVTARLRELEPLVHEYEQLRVVAESLSSPNAVRPGGARNGGNGAGAASRVRPPVARASSKGAGQRSRRRAPRGHNREAILRLVGERPGISNGEIADVTGINRRVVSTAVSKYKRDGLLAGEGDGVRLAVEPAGDGGY